MLMDFSRIGAVGINVCWRTDGFVVFHFPALDNTPAPMTRPFYIAPSILSADFSRLGEEITACEAAVSIGFTLTSSTVTSRPPDNGSHRCGSLPQSNQTFR